MSKKKPAGFDRMSKLAGQDDVFDDTFTLKRRKKKDEKDKEEKE